MDNHNDPDIIFDEKGICNYCTDYIKTEPLKGLSEQDKLAEFKKIIQEIKANHKGGKYHCILGISGGLDSTYLCHLVVEYGLNPLVVHYDNGWNSELAVKNIERIITHLNLDLITYVNDWEEIKSLQRAFIKASVVDIELITDQAIIALIFKLSLKHNIHYIFTGHNYKTEAILPTSWYHLKTDSLNIKAINRKFGNKKLKTYPMLNIWQWRKIFKKKISQQVLPLNYINYNKALIMEMMMEKYGWKDYGGKHNESIFTRFYQGYILPGKFNIDKRRAHLSTLICSGQILRDEALVILNSKPYREEQMAEDKAYLLKKLELTEEEFEKYMNSPEISHLNYPSYYNRHYKILSKITSILKFLRLK